MSDQGTATGGTKGSMQEGMTNKSVPCHDTSMEPKGGSVNDNATRSDVGKTSKSLGPRVGGS